MIITRFERYLADHHPFVGEKQLQLKKPAGTMMKFHGHVPGFGHDGVGRVRVRDGFREEVFAANAKVRLGV